MTVEQYWLAAPIVGLASLGGMFVLYGIFRNQVERAFAWFDNKPLWVMGLIMIGQAAVLGIIAWLIS